PDHPEIFARWAREAAAYRAAARDAEFALAYGLSPRQTLDLFPAKDNDEMTALALFIHGGWWRSVEPAMCSQVAPGPNARGLTVAVAGYDFCPQVSIATIIEQMRAACLWLWRRYRKRIFVYGHSAGGHLAACLLAQDWKVPDGGRRDAVVGSLESSEFLRQSKITAEGWRARGVAARYEEIAGMNRFTIVDALSDPRSAMTRRVVDLAQMVSAL